MTLEMDLIEWKKPLLLNGEGRMPEDKALTPTRLENKLTFQ